ncbi:MAG: SIMPL domain-containing protein [Rhodobacteraceae bacterium]|nr:SIMPL domain-containing protein [Paracoccaceae bacterium]
MRMVGILVAVLAFSASGLQAQEHPIEARKLLVQSEGIVTAEPDMAMITVGVTQIASTAAAALQANSAEMKKVFDMLGSAGVAARDMQTLGLSLQPRRERRSGDDRPPKIVGFEAVNSLRIRVRNVDSLGDVLDQLAKAGANQLHSINFAMQEPRPLLDQARRAAVKDARLKAELYAQAAGIELGQVFRIEETFGGREQPQSARGAVMMAESVPVALGENGIISRVQVVYLLD